MTTTAAAAGTRSHTGTYRAEPRQVGLARAVLAGWLGGGPQADEAIMVASEFATNAVVHSASRHGGASSGTRSTACGASRKTTPTPISTPKAATRTR